MNLDVNGNPAKPRPCCGSDHRGRVHGPQCALPDGFPETAEQVLCADCPPSDYPTDETRCAPCPRRKDVRYTWTCPRCQMPQLECFDACQCGEAAPASSKRRMYDERCYDLAVHFIGTEKKDELCADLANDIQQAVEDWFERHPGSGEQS